MPDFKIEPTKVKVKKIKILVEGTPPAEATVFVETCAICGAEAQWVPTTLVRPNHDATWKVNGGIPPPGWKDSRCAACLAKMEAMGG